MFLSRGVGVPEEVLPGLFRIQVPLPGNPLKYLNSYLIKGEDSALMIDTGFDMDECYTEIVRALGKINVDLKKTDILITHLHADHMGLVDRLAQSKVYVGDVEAKLIEVIKNPSNYWSMVSNYFETNGFPEGELESLLEYNSGIKYSLKRTDFQLVKDGDVLNYGNYKFKVIHTPGHTPGHICLYEPEKKILVSGDHILFDITPNISWWSLSILEDPLEEYIKSLDKIYRLNIEKTLPGHRSIGGNPRDRIVQLKEHHNKRLEEILNALRRGAKTAWEVTPQISWDIKFKNWTDVPIMQKYFAVGETIAHLIHLERKGLIKSEEKNGKIIYLPANH